MLTLANIATRSSKFSTDFRNRILDAGVLHEVAYKVCRTEKRPRYLKTSVWLIQSLLRYPSPDFDKVEDVFSSS